LAEEVESICAAYDLVTLATATLRAVVNLFACTDVMFSAFDLQTYRPIVHQQSRPGRSRPSIPKLERSRNLAASLNDGAEVVTVADRGKDEYYVIYETADDHPPELRIPFFLQPDILCLLSLGKKDTGTDFEIEEIDALRILVCVVSRCQFASSNRIKKPSATGVVRPGAAGAALPAAFQRLESYDRLLGDAPTMQRVHRLIAQIAATEAPVLITGESGTGKELVARAIQHSSRRSGQAMVIVNCAALPDSLVESELFGHERGAFTGALACKQGKFEFAKGSTLFLDEIGDLSPAVQAKLLRVLQDGTFQRIGGNSTMQSDVRLITATNKNLLQAIASGAFREDLYYRINVVQIELPPLRERREDIPLLIDYYLDFYNRRYSKRVACIAPGLWEWMQDYAFPGNVRELKNIVERAVIMENDPATIQAILQVRRATPAALPGRLQDLQRDHIRAVLDETHHNISAAARKLGIARKTLREKIVRYQI